jgi:hypothetical protein
LQHEWQGNKSIWSKHHSLSNNSPWSS